MDGLCIYDTKQSTAFFFPAYEKSTELTDNRGAHAHEGKLREGWGKMAREKSPRAYFPLPSKPRAS